jgi:acyl dehydratase
MRGLLAIVALAAFVVPGAVRADKANAHAAVAATVRAAQSLTLGDLRVQRRAPGGRVRGSLAAAPAGARLEVVVRLGSRRVGHRTVVAAGGRTRFSVRVDRASRARLRRMGHLDLRIDATAGGAGARVSTSTTARVTRG